jgi:hypothetical protein
MPVAKVSVDEDGHYQVDTGDFVGVECEFTGEELAFIRKALEDYERACQIVIPKEKAAWQARYNPTHAGPPVDVAEDRIRIALIAPAAMPVETPAADG